jgi:hypothetical protein
LAEVSIICTAGIMAHVTRSGEDNAYEFAFVYARG